MGGPRVRLRGIVGGIGHEKGKALLGEVKPMSSTSLARYSSSRRPSPGNGVVVRDVLRLVAEQRDVNAGFDSCGSG